MQKEDNNMTAMNEVNTVNERNMDMEGKAVKEKRTYTVKEIQEILDVSKPTVYALLKRKEFHSHSSFLSHY